MADETPKARLPRVPASRVRALEASTAIAVAHASAGNGYDAGKVIAVAKALEGYLKGER